MPQLYCFGQQIQRIFQKICYKAFGQILSIPQQTTWKGQKMEFQIDIARRMYDVYHGEGFRYSDHGITPKGLAQEMEVHLKEMGGIEWEIDQFGNFQVRPTDQYLQNMENLLIKNDKYGHLLLPEFQQLFPSLIRETHIFDFHLVCSATLNNLRRLRDMEAYARIQEQFNGSKVIRNIYTEQPEKTNPKILQFIKILKLSKQFAPQLKPISKLKAVYTAGENNYFACSPETTVHYEHQLPSHKLIKHYVGRDQSIYFQSVNLGHIQELLNETLRAKKHYKFEKHPGEWILGFGELMSAGSLDEGRGLVQDMKKEGFGNEKLITILENSYRSLREV